MAPMNTCPTCRQLLPPPSPEVYLPTVQRRIVELVRQTGRRGIASDRLFDLVYSGDPDGGPLTGRSCLSVHIHQINRRLRPIGYTLRGTPSGNGTPGTYRYEKIDEGDVPVRPPPSPLPRGDPQCPLQF
jgi:hypothetical protein